MKRPPLVFARFLLAAAALWPIHNAFGQTGPPPARPNILWLVSEDNTYNYVGAYGDPLARTPNIDRLAADGIVFQHAYCPAPVCAPTRSTIITGRYAPSLGSQHMRSKPALPDGVKFFPEYLRAAGYFCTNNAKTDYNTSTPWGGAWDEKGKKAHWSQRRPGQPFFAVFNFEQSHESKLHARQPLVTDPAKVRVPAYLPDTPGVRADCAQYYDCVARADAAIGKVLAELAVDGLAEDTIVFYYSDNGGVTPRSKRFLYDNGTHTALIARFPMKFQHLAPGAPGTKSDELVNYVDLAPTVLSLAGVPRPAQFQGRAIAGPDRGPAPEFTYMFRNRMDERYDFSRAVTDGRFYYVRHYLPHRPAGQHVAFLWRQASMREWEQLYRAGKLNATQRAFFAPRAPEELFDCRADPDNVRNLAGDPAQRATLERLRAANRAHLLRIRDTGFFPEAAMIALAAGKSPAIPAANAKVYPLERLIELTDALQLGAPSATAVVAALRDPCAVVRYWAVTGTLLWKTGPDVAPLFDDPDASVRVAAAEAVLRRGASAAAWNVLAAALEPSHSRELRLTVLNALPYLPAAPDSFRELAEMDGYLGRAVEYLTPKQP